MRSYIKEWFKKDFGKLADEGKKVVEMVPITVDERNKRTSTTSDKKRYDHIKFILITSFFLYQVLHPVTPPV
jgi:hypothetical protein